MKKNIFVLFMLALGGLLFAETVDFVFYNSIHVFPDEGEAYAPGDFFNQDVPGIELIEINNESRRATLYYTVGPDSYYIEPVDVLLLDGDEMNFFLEDESSLYPFIFDSSVLGEFILYFDDNDMVTFDGLTMAQYATIIHMSDWSIIANGFWTTIEMQDEEDKAEEVEVLIRDIREYYKDAVFN
jgi:hypothetical protein